MSTDDFVKTLETTSSWIEAPGSPTMLKSTSLGRYWQDNSERSSFTRVRCISTGGSATPHVYGSLKYNKARANSVPDTGTGRMKLLKFRKMSVPFGSPVLIERQPLQERNKDELNQIYSNASSTSNSDQSLSEVGDNGGRLLVCTLDTEQNERNLEGDGDSVGQSPSRNGSVEMVTSNSVVSCSSQLCCRCRHCLEYSDMVVVFDEDTYHLGCFRCGQCKEQVDPALNFLVLEDGSPLCAGCSPLCHGCRERIVSGHISVLNKDFHEGCLKCSVCKKVREGGSCVFICRQIV